MSEPERFTRWDAVDHLKTEADIAAYLAAAIEEAGEDAVCVSSVLADIARARAHINAEIRAQIAPG